MSETPASSLKCPKGCGPLRQEAETGGVVVDRCRRCGGTWLDRGELGQLRQTADQRELDELSVLAADMAVAFARAADEDAPSRDCCCCGQTLIRQEHPHCPKVLVDACPGCHGVWLDRSELRVLLAAFVASEESTDGLFTSFCTGLRTMLGAA